jgi:hypothetical protein
MDGHRQTAPFMHTSRQQTSYWDMRSRLWHQDDRRHTRLFESYCSTLRRA